MKRTPAKPTQDQGRAPLRTAAKAMGRRANNFGLRPVAVAASTARCTFLFQPESETATVLIPEIVQPPNNQNSCAVWACITRAFCNEADCIVKDGNCWPFDFAPDSPREWLAAYLDELRKAWLSHLANEDHRHYLIHQDIGGWAYLFAVRELSLHHPAYDEDRVERDDLSSDARDFLIERFFDFARARRNFHALLLAGFYKLNGYDRNIRLVRLNELLSGQQPVARKTSKPQYGRPRGVEWPHQGRDLWLALIEPVARLNGWTYADVLRAERLFFGSDLDRRDSLPFDHTALRSFQVWLASPDAAKHGSRFGRSQEEIDWIERQLSVTSTDAKKMANRCKKVGINLPPKNVRRGNQEPPKLATILLMPAASVVGKRITLPLKELEPQESWFA